MWFNDLGKIYNREVLSERAIPRGVVAPEEGNRKISYPSNKMGIRTSDMGDSSAAGNVAFGNPYEQEETPSLNIGQVLAEIDALERDLSHNSPTDRVAIMVLSKLRKRLTVK